MAVHKLVSGYASFLEMCSTVSLVRTGGVNILIDSGSRAGRDEIVTALAALDLAPDDIHIVANTHLHMDHCWNNDLFTRASWYCSEKELAILLDILDLVHDTGDRTDEIIGSYLFLEPREVPSSLRRTVEAFLYRDKMPERLLSMTMIDRDSLAELGLHVLDTPGHTSGHIAYIYQNGETDLECIFAGDALIEGKYYGKDQIKVLFTEDMGQYRTSKDKIENRRGLCFPGHGQVFLTPSGTVSTITYI